MVATLTTRDTTASPQPVATADGQNEEQTFDLAGLNRRPGACRGVTPRASDWLSRMERRDGIYLPI